MPLVNGDAMPSLSEDVLDFSKALEVLEKEYPQRDGIDVKTLIDSAKNGGLTYNDFLMLPGYIGKPWKLRAVTSCAILLHLTTRGARSPGCRALQAT